MSLVIPTRTDRWSWLRWLGVVALAVVLMAVVAPGRGAFWYNDDGLFLVLSWNAAHGFGLDLGTAQAPHYLFHALLMKAGLSELLYFRYVNYFVILASSMVFFLGLDQERFRSPVVPVAVAASLLITLNSIQSPNSLALAFFLTGAGLYFMARDRDGWPRSALLGASGVFFGAAGFMHAAVAIAMILVVAICVLLDRSVR